jgi:hypothetical protein
MAGTSKVLSEINNTREEISHLVDLLSRRRNIKVDITDIIKEAPLDAAIFAVLAGILVGIFSNKIKSLLKFAFFIYTTKQSISYLSKFKN